MLGFEFACERHQKIFIESLARTGCGDPKKMEVVRRRLLAWLSETYPGLVLDSFNKEACLGCGLEEAHVDLESVRRATQEIAERVMSQSNEA